MDLVVYEKDNKSKAIIAYKNCYSIPQKYNTIVIEEQLYEVIANPCFCYEKNTVWLFVEKCK